MIVSYEGHDYTWDAEQITVDEWRELKRKYQMTPAGFEKALGEADPDASTFAYWVMLRAAGQQHLTLGDHLRPDIIKLNAALAAAAEREQQPAEPEPDPTRPSPSPVASASPPAVPGPAQPAEGVSLTGS